MCVLPGWCIEQSTCVLSDSPPGESHSEDPVAVLLTLDVPLDLQTRPSSSLHLFDTPPEHENYYWSARAPGYHQPSLNCAIWRRISAPILHDVLRSPRNTHPFPTKDAIQTIQMLDSCVFLQAPRLSTCASLRLPVLGVIK